MTDNQGSTMAGGSKPAEAQKQTAEQANAAKRAAENALFKKRFPDAKDQPTNVDFPDADWLNKHPNWTREKVHVGDGNSAWGPWFDPVQRVKDDAKRDAELLKQRGVKSDDSSAS